MNGPLPVVSVVISTYNRCEKLERALKSALAQTLKSIEIIIVDNASEDRTAEFVKSVEDQRIRYIRHDTNKGGPAARNTGIKTAQASLVALLDDDDEWLPRKLELQVKKFQESSPCVGLVYVGTEVFDEHKNKILRTNLPAFRGNVYQRLLMGTILGSVSSVLVKKECFEKAGLFDEQLTSCQDWDMWLCIARYYEFEYVSEVLARINMHGDQISTNYASLIPGRTRMVKKHWEEFQEYPEILIVHLKRIGKLHCLNGTWAEAINWFKKAAAVRKIEIFKIAAWCLLELPLVKFSSYNRSFKRYIKQ
ncbi:MAG: glycosyltransferase [Candidatus Omnitrophica bacterium]|nr:glycosyltransferase [Candidatus Omnitrophota bacterium]